MNLRSVMRRVVVSALITAGLLLAGGSPANAATGLADREADPVVLTGAQAPLLIGTEPASIVAFTWDGSWKQVPVQVDERKVVDYRVIRQRSMSNPQFLAEVYADPNTYAGADGVPQRPTGKPTEAPIPGTTGDPMFDNNDEIAMMSHDAGASAAHAGNPGGVVGSSRTPVRVEDPLNPGTSQFLYLFHQASGLDPSAGQDLVSYRQTYSPPLAGGYFGGYNFTGISDDVNGPPVNPEASVVKTDRYEETFPGRWMVDGLKITAGGSSGIDILDGDKSTITTTGCGRNELTFSRGGGGSIANIDGPVRAIRSYIGANSGTFTQRDQIYYQGRIDTNTYLRVHQGIADFLLATDYSEAAFGMTYRNSVNPSGVKIDGQGDTDGLNLTGKLDWEQATGDQGSLTNVTRIVSDIPDMTYSSYYLDNMSPPSNASVLCSGDDHAIGASGPRVRMPGSGRNTDPVLPPTAPSTEVNNFTGYRTMYIGAPGATAGIGTLRSQQTDSPLSVSTGAGIDPIDDGPEPVPGNPGKPGRQNWVGLKVTVSPENLHARVGVRKTIKVTVRNIGDQLGRKIRICPLANDRLVKTGSCNLVKKLKPGKKVSRKFTVRLRRAAAGKRAVKVKFRAKASKSHARSVTVNLRPTGRLPQG